MAKRIDFKHVRAHANIGTVIAAYGIELQKDGSKPDQMKGLCPFHEDTKPSLKVNTDKNVYKCFACNAGGNVLDFVKEIEGIELRPAAQKVADICGIAVSAGAGAPAKKKQPAAQTKPSSPPPQPAAETPADEELDGDLQNRVLTFELKLTQDDALKVWLEGRGIDHHAQRAFGLGRASQRSKTIADRLAIPLHNSSGTLIGYCGRYVGDDMPDDDTPKYILPKGFHKDLELFNFHRAFGNDQTPAAFVVMESYFSVMRHHDSTANGLPCISPMGHELSDRQLQLLTDRFPGGEDTLMPRAIIVADGDEPGRDGAARIAGRLATHFWTQTVHLSDGVKPHHLAKGDLTQLLRSRWKDHR